MNDAAIIDPDMEREYNNRAKVPDFAAIAQDWARKAAAFRAGHAHAELGLAYGPGPRQIVDIFWPGTAQDVPVALFIHGGYWQALDASWFSHLAGGLNAHGIAVALPTHDLCPSVSLVALVEQLRVATEMLYRRHGHKMLATGHSAGGHLTAMLMATDWPARDPSLPRDLVMAGLSISGLFDLVPLVETTINIPLGLDVQEAGRLSPLRLASPGLRLHAVVGGKEGPEYARQSREMAASWGGSWQSVPGADHFTIIPDLADPDSELVHKALELQKGQAISAP